jgi:sialate O-acetylesterase
MILQRDQPLKIWGFASPGEKISVQLAQQKQKTVADANGRWQMVLKPMPAGGPYTMQSKGSNTIVLKEILMGDVWFCSGQSNMEHQMKLHAERYADDISAANNPLIRQFLVPRTTSLIAPQDDLNNGNWIAANPVSVLEFSAVAYFFANTIYHKYHVPIGIINASVGGTPVEAWTSESGLKNFDDVVDIIRKNKDTAIVNDINRKAAANNAVLFNKPVIDKGLTEPVKWFENNYQQKEWQSINVPGYWEDQGIKDLDGIVWYSREIELPAAVNEKPARIALGRIVDADEVYVNGIKVGSTAYQYPQRRYNLTAGIIKAGKNRIVIRVQNNNGKGGFVPDKPYCVVVGNDSFDLKGGWYYKIGEVYDAGRKIQGGIALQNQPASLFNGMVSPVINYSIKGVLWYQGETNANKPLVYKKWLPALIADWRYQWKQPELPFLFVQLPNFMATSYLPEESNWALLREAQFQALSIPNTAMAVAVDLGEWNDIHPDRKAEVGIRLALASQHVAYLDTAIVYSGPLFKSQIIEGDKIIISFNNTGSGLTSNDNEPLRWFAIAGADKKFVWAKARIAGDNIIVSSDKIDKPLFVRYAWADNPVLVNFYNKDGLPASPFRTDTDE